MKYIDLVNKKVSSNNPQSYSKGWNTIQKNQTINKTYNIYNQNKKYNIQKNIKYTFVKTKSTDGLFKQTMVLLFNVISFCLVMLSNLLLILINSIIHILLFIGFKSSSIPVPKWFTKLVNKLNGSGGRFEE